MNICFLTNGTRGDIQPLIYLGEFMISRGHKVKMVAGENFLELLKPSGIEHIFMPVNLQDYMNSSEGRELLKKMSNPFLYFREMKNLMRQFSSQTLDAYWSGSQKTDLLISTTGALGDILIAQKLDIPLVEIQLQPLHPSRDFTYPLLPFNTPFGLLNKLSYYLMESMLNGMFRGELNRWQKRVFNRVLLYRGGVFSERRRLANLIVGAYSSSLITRPKNWPERVVITGFLRPEESENKLDSVIQSFLDSGEAPIYIGFGSMALKSPEKLIEIIKKLLEESNFRIVLATQWTNTHNLPEHENLLVIDGAPHNLLFKRVSGVIHHGGAGTMSAALYAGTPQVIYPCNADQPFWARILYKNNLIPKYHPIKKLSYRNMRDGITQMTSESSKKRAEDMRELLIEEDGLTLTTQMIEMLLHH